MLLGPIFQVELVSTSRRRRYYSLRVLYGALILLVLWFCYEQAYSYSRYSGGQVAIQTASNMAAGFFHAFSWLQMMAIMVVGPAMAVGTISSERERRTIEYLFATDLSNLEIVGGKTIARLLLIGKLVLVSLPILFIFRLLGGIPADALITVFVLSASTALLVTSIGICVSVWSSRSRDGVIRVYVIMFAVFALPFVLYGIAFSPAGKTWIWLNLIGPVVAGFLKINPFFVLMESLGNRLTVGLGTDIWAVGWTVLCQVAVSVVVLTLSTLAVRRVHLGSTSRGSKQKRRSLVESVQWKPALGARPMLWKEMFAGTSRTRLGFVGFLALILILFTLVGLTIYAYLDAVERQYLSSYLDYATGMTGFVGSAILLLLASRASSLVTTEVERDCWTSILATPLTGREVMMGKMWGNLYSMRWALMMLAVIWGFGVLLDPGYFLGVILSAANFFIAAWYVTNLGLFFSLRSKTSLRAMGSTLGTLIFTGGGYIFCCCLVFLDGAGDEALFMFSFCIPFLLAFPTAAYDRLTHRNWGGPDDEIYMAYGFGTLIYLIAGTVLYFVITESFDRSTGRTTNRIILE